MSKRNNRTQKEEEILETSSSSNSSEDDSGSDSDSSQNDPSPLISQNTLPTAVQQNDNVVIWDENDTVFVPRFTVTAPRPVQILNSKLTSHSTELQIFLQMFPLSLINYIAQCTNKRLEILHNQKNKRVFDTDGAEIEIVLGILMVMCYNRVPSISDYWSMDESLGNATIKKGMARNRFQLLISKLYFADPEKKADCTKTYYNDELLECLNKQFKLNREDSPYQSIDESMTKFKGRSTLKQFLPMKPIKRGIKSWVRSDSDSGYTYEIRIYAGKTDDAVCGTLGERVIKQLTATAQRKDITFAFDRFFTSVNLLSTIDYACLGTCISNRRNVPKFTSKLKKADCEFRTTKDGILAVRWRDTKDVILLSNCHNRNINIVRRRQKDGSLLEVNCPEAIYFYNKIMGGVDLGDQKVRIYDLDRKSMKWWKKVFFRMLMVSVVNSWILYQQLRRRETSLLSFIVPLAESLISHGKSKCTVIRKKTVGRPSKKLKFMTNVDHLPLKQTSRRRCIHCSAKRR